MKVSDFMLERYRFGELDSDDQNAVSEALAADESLRFRLQALDDSDRELKLLYPKITLTKVQRRGGKRKELIKRRVPRVTRYAGIAAVVLAVVLLPVIYFARGGSNNMAGAAADAVADGSAGNLPGDRAKGSAPADCELSLYLKGDGEILLSDKSMLSEGNTVQLAYTAPAGEKYGVIFSVDGRSVVTLHYPYRQGQSSLLVSGKRTFLDEAYTLDDAPNYEVFVMVISDEPLDVDAVLREALKIAETSAFDDCEVEILTVLKN